MEIHKPHAAKTWKEFFIELGTIVLGILIALGLEQSIEALHERQLAQDSEAAIRAELSDNAGRISYRLAHQACIERRLDEISTLLAGWADGKEFPAGLHIGVTGDVPITDQRWQANLNSGRFSQENDAAQSRQATSYGLLRALDNFERDEIKTWTQLRGLERGSHFLGADSRPVMIQALLNAQDQALAVSRLGPEFIAQAKALNAAPGAAFQAAVADTTCQPMRPNGAGE